MPLAPAFALQTNDRSIGGSKYFSGVETETCKRKGGGLSWVMLVAKRDQQHTHIRGIPSFGEMPFIGRTQEIEQAIQMFTEATQGTDMLSWSVAQAGSVRPALPRKLPPARNTLGATVAIGRCWREGEAPPLWPWRRILRELDAPRIFLQSDDRM